MLISVIIPAYNAARTIQPCLAAIRSQQAPGLECEIIVVDDGSTDETAMQAQRCGARVLSQPNSGPASARNRGANAARGSIVVFTDADCEPAEGWLQAMIVPFGRPTVAGVMGRYRTRQQSLTARFAQAEFEERYRLMKEKDSLDLVATYSAAYRREIFLAEGGFDTRFRRADNEDVEFSYRLARRGHLMVFAPDAIVYHTHPDQPRKYMRQKFNRGIWRIVTYSMHPGKAFKDTYTPGILKLQIMLIPLLCAASCVAAFGFVSWILPLIVGVAFLMTTLPFVRLTFSIDKTIALLAPLFLLVRSVAICAGISVGVIVAFFIRRKSGNAGLVE